MKYLVLLAVLAVVLGVWRSRQTKSESGSGSESSAPPSPTPPLPQEMVACAHCSLHLPRSEALAEVGHFYCSREHQGLGPR